MEAKRRLKVEVIHALSSGNKTHSKMSEVNLVLPQRDNHVLIEAAKVINPDDAVGAALEDALRDVATRKKKSGSPDEWELAKDAWRQYDPAFHHISTHDHQGASENRPKPKKSTPYSPRPAQAHAAFTRIRRDLTADSCILAIIYRILHVHCRQNEVDTPNIGKEMYNEEIKSETVLARAVHLLTLGAYAWESDWSGNSPWKEQGGDEVGSVFHAGLAVFHDNETTPDACDWVKMALLRDPSDVMNSEWYNDKDTALILLKNIVDSGNTGFLGSVGPSVRMGAKWLCDFATKHNPTAASLLLGKGLLSTTLAEGGTAVSKDEDMERRKKAAKEKAMAMMKVQMNLFAANLGESFEEEDDDNDNKDDDNMSGITGVDGSQTPPRQANNNVSGITTPTRSGEEVLEILDLSPTGDGAFLTSSPNTPRTPRSSGCSTPSQTSYPSCATRLFKERPLCIVCGADAMQIEDKKKSATTTNTSSEEEIALCGLIQASTVIKGSGGPSQDHVGIHVSLCGHAIHQSCCDTYIRTTLSQRDDRLEGGKRKEFRCPLCQRLSNCLVPFVDVAMEWVEKTTTRASDDAPESIAAFKSEEDELMSVESMNSCYTSNSLHDFLSKTKWWAARNDSSLWDGQCAFSTVSNETKLSSPDQSMSPSPSKRLKKIQSNLPGKKELISAWNAALKTPRLVKRRAFSLSTAGDLSSSDLKPSLQKESNSDVLRRFFDQIIDVGHKADFRRLGEEALYSNFGEFRHYLSEKVIYNKGNKEAKKEIIDVSFCYPVSLLTLGVSCINPHGLLLPPPV